MTRTVSLVLVSPAGEVLGALPPFEVATPWWQEMPEVVAGAGADVTVLRLLHADRDRPPGGHVTYLAETAQRPAGLTPVEVGLADDPRRAAHAEVGGPAASLAWAAGALDRIGVGAAVARQQRTWNLSAIWRLEGPDGGPVAWLKQVPAFFRHEPVVMRMVDRVTPGLAPYVLAAGEHGRTLLEHVEGEDQYGAGPQVCAQVVAAVHPVQQHFAGRVGELLAAGVPDRRPSTERYERVAAPYLDEIPGLPDLIAGLPERLSEAAACGPPDTLIHGDLHGGNVRMHPGRLTLLDWADSAVSTPVLDILRLTDDPTVLRAWARNWTGCDPLRAVDLLRPVAALEQAAVYTAFLSAIEGSEHPYHATDVPECLARAATTA